jgi:MFS family permease
VHDASGRNRRRNSPAAPESWILSTLSPGAAIGLLESNRMLPQAAAHSVATSETPLNRSHRGLDWFSFFLADIQAGFGPFVAVYLTAHSWTQVDIGLVLTASGLVALAGQMPAGALVDVVRSKRLITGIALAVIGAAAIAMALWPIFPIVLGARALHAAASCILGPAIAVISLGLVGHAALGERIGRNARFASIGAGVSAVAMGACGYLLSDRAILFFTAILVVPALVSLARVGTSKRAPIERPLDHEHNAASEVSFRHLITNRQLLIFASCITLFQLANAAMLPLMGSIVTMHSGEWATVVIAACVVVPQLVVVGMAPWVGRQAQSRGRRPLLLLCFVALAARATLFAFVANPNVVVAIQVLDGISAAILGVMFPLVVADITRGTGRFSLGLGIVGSAVGIGASLSTIMAGYLFDHFGRVVTFSSLAGIAVLGLALVYMLMPETRPETEAPDGATDQGATALGRARSPSVRLETDALALGAAASMRSR